MSKKVIAFLLAFFLIETGTAYSLSFKLGGFFGGQNSFTDKYDAAPIGYVEQKIFEKGDLDIRVSLGLTYLDSTNFERSALYGYFETAANTFPLNANPTAADTYGVFGPYNANSKLLLIPFKIQAAKYFKLSKKPKSPEISVFAGLTAVYYREEYEQFTDSNDVLKNQKIFIDKTKNGINIGFNIGTGIKISKNVSVNAEYNCIKSTDFNTGLNNIEAYFRIEM